jgi:molybdenum cofactor cytidylyltransferase
MDSLAILVLAAGKSSRMKDIKQLLKINNKTLLETTLEISKKVNSKNVFCVLGANAEKIKRETSTKLVTYIFNKYFENGLSTSIVCGVHYIEKEHSNIDAILILLADQPNIDEQYLKNLINTYKKNSTKIIASNYGEKVGVPAIFSEKYFENLKQLKGDKGAKAFLNSDANKIMSIQTDKLIDLDTKQDYNDFLNHVTISK